jgi:putative endonuclease
MKNKKKSEWIVYIIESQNGKLYTGITNDLERRMNEHKTKKRGASFFHFSPPRRVVYQESQPNRSLASIRECQIKKMDRTNKLKLIES